MSFNKPRKPNFLDRKKGQEQTLNTNQSIPASKPNSSSLLDVMEDNKEFYSLLNYNFGGINIVNEIRRSIFEIQKIRERPAVCFVGNTVNPRANQSGNVIIAQDCLPFFEMISTIPKDIKSIDIILETPGGNGTVVPKLVEYLRNRFDHVGFIILNSAMSAGTIFATSGDEIIMNSTSHLGPIDPQVQKNGSFLPAQGILSLIEDIRSRTNERQKNRQPIDWTDGMLIQRIDPHDIGKAMNASAYSIKLVESYLHKYKFKYWTNHERSGGHPVTDADKLERAKKIAQLLCNHNEWKDHGHAIDRNAAWDVCELKITRSEDFEGLDRAMRRMWALFYWLFEYRNLAKFYVSENYSVIKSFKELIEKPNP